MAKKAPDPTPPKEVSAAQTGSSVSTAIANAFLQNPSEITPEGNTQVDPTGSYRWTDAYTGQAYDIPTFTRTTTYSPQQQAIKDSENAAKLNLTNLAKNQSSFLDSYLGKPLTLDNNATESRLFELGRKRLDPVLADRRESERTRLANQGIRLGSTAYDRAVNLLDQGENDAYNELLLKGRGQAVQETLTERNQPINEITALLSGGQVSQPQFLGANIGPIPTTDNAGIIGNYDQQRIQAAQMDNAFAQNILGGLFGLGSAGIFKYSDRRLKEDVHKVGKTDDGQNLYMFRYKGDSSPQIGLMAQEVEKKHPEAVKTMPSGFKAVDYGRAMGSIMKAA